MDFFGAFVRSALVIATLILFAVVLSTYLRLRRDKIRSSKILLVSIGFGIFFVHALFSLPEIFSASFDIDFNEDWHLLIILIGLFFILLGTLRND